MTIYSVKVPKLNQRKFPVTDTADKSNVVAIVVAGYTFNGSFALTNACGDWYKDDKGYYYWGGGLNIPQTVLPPKPPGAIPQPVVVPVVAPVIPVTGTDDVLTAYRIPDVWKKTKGANVKVAIIDSGLNYQHPNFIKKTNIQYYNVLNGSANATDCMDDTDAHGTACASVVGAQGPDVWGIAPDAGLIIIKATSDGNLFCKNLALGIDQAVAFGADVISISRSYYDKTKDLDLVEAAIARAVAKQIFIVASAAESGTGAEQAPANAYPAAYPSCIGVGSCDGSKNFANYTRMNNQIKILGPGTMPVLTFDSFSVATGTSYATPFVAAVCALYLAANQNKNATTFVNKMQSTADNKEAIQQQVSALYPLIGDISNLGVIDPFNIV